VEDQHNIYKSVFVLKSNIPKLWGCGVIWLSFSVWDVCAAFGDMMQNAE
jgi:hypothetical protein